jgi:spermidine/putrescine-binding protein
MTFRSASLSRRGFISATGAAALATPTRPLFAQSNGPLNWFAFGSFYGNSYLFEPWMAQTNMPFKQTLWGGADEMVAKMHGGASGLYDCASVPQQFVGLFAKEGIIQPIDLANVPNFNALLPEFEDSNYVKIDGKIWGVPFIWGANAIAYNTKHLPAVDSLSSLFDEKLKGRISMRDDPEDSLAVAALYLGLPEPFKLGDSELQEVKKLLLKQRPLIRSYWKNLSDLQTMFANDEISVAWAQLAVLAPLRAGGLDMGWVWPKEGALGFYVANVTVKGTPRKQDAEAFSNYLVGPDYGLRFAEKYGYATTSKLAIARMSPELQAKAGIDPARLKLLKFKDLIPNRAAWQRVWDEVKAS